MDLLTLELPGIRKVASGKVREIFDLGEHLLLVATDRISRVRLHPAESHPAQRGSADFDLGVLV